MPVPPVQPEVPVMQMLAARIPLTLLADLVVPGGPTAQEILRHEPADVSWLPRQTSR